MNTFSVVLYSDRRDRFYEAVSFAAAARAQGKKVILFLRGPALAAHLSGKWRPGAPALERGMTRLVTEPPEDTLVQIRSGKKVLLYACSAWVRMLGLDGGRVAAKVDAVVGLNAFLSQADGGPVLYL